MIVIVLGLAWLAGVYIGTSPVLPLVISIVLAFGASLLAVLWWRAEALRLALLAMAIFFAALTRGGTALPESDSSSVHQFNDREPIAIRGVIAEDPVTRSGAAELRLTVNSFKANPADEWQATHDLVQVLVPFYPQRRYGDALELRGKLETPRNSDPFPYREYLARQGIGSVLRYPEVTLLAENQVAGLARLLHDLRARLAASLARALPEPQAALAQGILLGQRSRIPSDLMDAFARTNTTHIIAISGANVSLLAGILVLVSRTLFGRRSATLLPILGIVTYMLLVGATPSVVRASLMGIAFAIATHFGRQHDTAASLILAAFAMTLLDPFVLFDLGFQLSFLGTAGLVFLAPLLIPRLSRLPGWLGGYLSATLAAEAATVPVIVLTFGQLSIVGPIANLFVPALLPPLMASAGITALGGSLLQFLGQLVGPVAWLFLTTMVGVVERLAALPAASLPVGRPALALIVAYYALLAMYLLHRSAPTTLFHVAWQRVWVRLPTVPLLAMLLIGAAIAWSAALTASSDRLRISVLDVGQGDAILIQTPERKILVDGGPSPETIVAALGRRLPFWDRTIDMVVLTHPNDDHLVGLISVLDRFEVKQVLETGVRVETASYAGWQELIRTRGVTRVLAVAGQEIALGPGIRASVLVEPPREGECGSSTNDSSVIMRVETESFSMLLTGDMGQCEADSLLRSDAKIRATVLKVPHHGGAGALSTKLLDSMAPEVAIISVGQGNRFGHPAPSTLSQLQQAGIKVYRTDVNGTTEVVVGSAGYHIKTQR